MNLRPLAGALGAEVAGVDLSAPLDGRAADAVRDAFHEHVVLLFREQSLSPEAHLALTRVFGEPESHPLSPRPTVPGHPEIIVLENRPGRRGARNDFWHSDISHAPRPPAVSLLHAIEVPEGRGDTMFCNMVAAWDALSQGMRVMLAGLTGVHSGEATMRRNNEEGTGPRIESVPEPEEHPVARTHPATGKKAIYVNPFFTVRFSDMTAEESRPLLDFLAAHATRPENVYRHRWRAGDVLLWDNRSAMHYAVRDYDESMPRLMRRTTAAGERPR